MKIYIAGRYFWLNMLKSVKRELNNNGFEITATWIDGAEEGKSREEIALLDFEDIDRADAILCFTEPSGSFNTSGGRHVELGYAIAKGKQVFLIGDRENVFYYHPSVVVLKSVTELIEKYGRKSKSIRKDLFPTQEF